MNVQAHVATFCHQTHPESLMNNFELVYNVDRYITTLLYINAIFDPIIYALRMREVRNGYYCLFFRCCKVRHDITLKCQYDLR